MSRIAKLGQSAPGWANRKLGLQVSGFRALTTPCATYRGVAGNTRRPGSTNPVSGHLWRFNKLHSQSRYNYTMKMESMEVFASLEGHLKAMDEIDLVVLRGHLILEQCLNALLARWIEPERLPKLNLMFAKKLDLYSALQEPRGQHWTEEIAHLRELNLIRNKLAHQLPSNPGHHADVKKWACSVDGAFAARVTHERSP